MDTVVTAVAAGVDAGIAGIAPLNPAGEVTGFETAILYQIARYRRAVRKCIDVRWRGFLLLRHCD